jgi:hypothetical protein
MGYNEHSFYCIKCGNKGIPIMRRQSFQHKKMHRKKLYCLHCKEEINHIECKTLEDVETFKINFENGVYVNEAEESISHVRDSRSGKIYMDTGANCQ